jgi:outer membrane protein assembly factor BamE (lipoprotein component of BamABCDE complex)
VLVSRARRGCPDCRRWVAAVALCATSLVSSGCTIGRYYTGAPLRGEPSALIDGQSTKSDVLRLFGPPTTISHQTDGDTFVYLYVQQNTSTFTVRDPVIGYTWFSYSRSLSNRDTLLVLFDFTGVVRSVAVAHQVEEMPML